MMQRILALSTLVSLLMTLCLHARADDDIHCGLNAPREHQNVFTWGSGVGWLSADEFVYEQGNRVSHLIWESQAPIVHGSFRIPLTDGINVSGRGKMAFSGRSKMLDYDWNSAGPAFRSFAFHEWTDRSTHDNTELEHYISASLSLERNFKIAPCQALGFHGGVKYTDVKWTTYGGSVTYSIDGLRDFTADFFESIKGISYQQFIPAAFIGGQWGANFDKWSFRALGRVGATLVPRDEDHHWKRGVFYSDQFDNSPFFEMQADISYAFDENASVYLAASYERYFLTRGNTTAEVMSTGNVIKFRRSAGMALQTHTVSAGFRYSF